MNVGENHTERWAISYQEMSFDVDISKFLTYLAVKQHSSC
jgi:hypothetical protein